MLPFPDTGILTSAGDHGSTFAGNPLVCHVACTVFDIINQPAFLESVELKGQRLRAGEALLHRVDGVRCLGAS